MDTSANETSTDELTQRSVDVRIFQAADPISRRVEEVCAPQASCTEVDTAGESEASSLRQYRECFSPSRKRHDNRCTLKSGVSNFASFHDIYDIATGSPFQTKLKTFELTNGVQNYYPSETFR